MWYGYIYYVLTFLSVFVFSACMFKLFYLSTINYKKLFRDCFFIFFNLFLLLTLTAIIVLYYALDLFSSFVYQSILTLGVENSVQSYLTYFDHSFSTYLLNTDYTNLSLLSIYSFPFVYIFIFITILSLLFCLAYNSNELTTFSLYIVIILAAGYVLFFTDSLILFFFSYEVLLVPSFFILYNFAKTRRCVEAAYLMFF